METGSRFGSNGITVSLPASAYITSGIMAIGFVLSILFAILFNFKEATRTHCHVKNYLPSISAAIADPPSSYMWRLSVTLCATQRLLAVFVHYSQYNSLSLGRPQYKILCILSAAFELIENLALIGLTCISSVENHGVHEKFFIIFQASSMLFMLVMCLVHRLAVNYGVSPTKGESRDVRNKTILLAINYLAFIVAIYFFYRHNKYCEPGVYSIFAGLEYVVVLSNIGFHFLVTRFFSDREFRLGCRRRASQY